MCVSVCDLVVLLRGGGVWLAAVVDAVAAVPPSLPSTSPVVRSEYSHAIVHKTIMSRAKYKHY